MALADHSGLASQIPLPIAWGGTGATDVAGAQANLGIGGGTGTVTGVSVVTANGISGTVATASTTPAITLAIATQAAGTNNTTGATTAFVTTAIANAIAGVNPAVAVKAATTQASDTSGLTYNNGAAGIGAFFTGSVNTPITFDGVSLTAVNQRVLIKNDTQSPSGAFNGVYYLSQLQTGILPPILIRALDYDMPSDINNTGAIPVVSGTVNSSTSWLLTSSVTTVGTDPLTYVQFSVNPSSVLTTGMVAPIRPSSSYPNDTSGSLFPNYYSGGGGNASPVDYGMGVVASLASDKAWELRFPIPPTVPPGTMKLRILGLANAATGAAKFTISDAVVAAGASPSAATLTAETQSTVTWGAGDADKYKETKVALTPTASGNGMLVVALTFNTSGFTLAQNSTWIATLIWE